VNKLSKRTLVCLLIVAALLPQTFVFAESNSSSSGDPMWKLPVKHMEGLSEQVKSDPRIFIPENTDTGDQTAQNAPDADDIEALENELIRLVNEERAKYSLAPLTENSELSCVARCKSQDMLDNNYFSHQSPTYGSPYNMLSCFGIKYYAAGENIAYGYSTASEVMSASINSPGHRSNILGIYYDQIGVGFAKSEDGTYYWTQLFIESV
jgi:uncharacterized YkwD family protein